MKLETPSSQSTKICSSSLLHKVNNWTIISTLLRPTFRWQETPLRTDQALLSNSQISLRLAIQLSSQSKRKLMPFLLSSTSRLIVSLIPEILSVRSWETKLLPSFLRMEIY